MFRATLMRSTKSLLQGNDMSGVALGIAAAAAVVGTGYSIYNGERQASAQSDAQNQAKKQAEDQAKQADQAMNKANQKSPDTSAILSAVQQSGKSGASGTMLTGPTGIDSSSLTLGKSTLLGQ